MADTLKPLKPWSELRAKVGNDRQQLEALAADYTEAIQAREGRPDLLPQDPSGELPPKAYALGLMTHEGQPLRKAGPIESLVQGARSAPIVRQIVGAPPPSDAEPVGPLAETMHGLGAAAPGMAGLGAAGGIGAIVGGPAGAATAMKYAAPLVFGTEGALGEYQREQDAGQEINPHKVALHGIVSGGVATLPVGKLAKPITNLIEGQAGSTLLKNIGSRAAEAGIEGVALGTANSVANAALEGRAPTLEEIGQGVQGATALTTVMAVPRLFGSRGEPGVAPERPPVEVDANGQGKIPFGTEPQRGERPAEVPGGVTSNQAAGQPVPAEVTPEPGRGPAIKGPIGGGPITDIPPNTGQPDFAVTPTIPGASRVERAPTSAQEAMASADLAAEQGDFATARALRQRAAELAGAERTRGAESLLGQAPTSEPPPVTGLTKGQEAAKNRTFRGGRPGGPISRLIAERDARERSMPPPPRPPGRIAERAYGPEPEPYDPYAAEFSAGNRGPISDLIAGPGDAPRNIPRPQGGTLVRPSDVVQAGNPGRPTGRIIPQGEPVMPRRDPGFANERAFQADVTEGLDQLQAGRDINDTLDQLPQDRPSSVRAALGQNEIGRRAAAGLAQGQQGVAAIVQQAEAAIQQRTAAAQAAAQAEEAAQVGKAEDLLRTHGAPTPDAMGPSRTPLGLDAPTVDVGSYLRDLQGQSARQKADAMLMRLGINPDSSMEVPPPIPPAAPPEAPAEAPAVPQEAPAASPQAKPPAPPGKPPGKAPALAAADKPQVARAEAPGALSPIQRQTLEAAVQELEERIRTRTNAKGQPLSSELVQSLERQHADLQRRLGRPVEGGAENPKAPSSPPPVAAGPLQSPEVAPVEAPVKPASEPPAAKTAGRIPPAADAAIEKGVRTWELDGEHAVQDTYYQLPQGERRALAKHLGFEGETYDHSGIIRKFKEVVAKESGRPALEGRREEVRELIDELTDLSAEERTRIKRRVDRATDYSSMVRKVEAAKKEAATARRTAMRAERRQQPPLRVEERGALSTIPESARRTLIKEVEAGTLSADKTPTGATHANLVRAGLYEKGRGWTDKGRAALLQAEAIAHRSVEFIPDPPGPAKSTPRRAELIAEQMGKGSKGWKVLSRILRKEPGSMYASHILATPEGLIASDGHMILRYPGAPEKVGFKSGSIYNSEGVGTVHETPKPVSDYLVPHGTPIAQVPTADLIHYAKQAGWGGGRMTDLVAESTLRFAANGREMHFDPRLVEKAAQALRDLGVERVDVHFPKLRQEKGETGGTLDGPMVLREAGRTDPIAAAVMPMRVEPEKAPLRYLDYPIGKIPTRKTTTLGMFGGREGTEQGRLNASTGDAAVDALFERPQPGRLPWRDRLREAWAGVQRGVGEYLGFETDLRLAGDNELRHARRLFKDTEFHVRSKVERDLKGVLGELNEKAGELDQFERMVVLRDFIDRMTRDQGAVGLQPGGFDQARYQSALDNLYRRATPKVLEALTRHDALMRKIAEEQVELGVLSPKVLEHGTYYPHLILDYSDAIMQTLPDGGSKKLTKAGRYWTRQAEGSTDPINTDYVETMQGHLRAVYRANAIDRFARDWLPKRDALAAMTPEQRRVTFGVGLNGEIREPGIHGKGYTVDGKQYRVYRYAPFKALASESAHGYLPTSDVEAMVLREQARLSGPVYLVPEHVFQNFQKFTVRDRMTQMEAKWSRWTQRRKSLLLDFLGLGFQITNAVGDTVDSLRYSTRGTLYSVTHLPEIIRAIKYAHEDPAFQKLLIDQGVLEGSTFYGAELPHLQALGKSGQDHPNWGPRIKSLSGRRGGAYDSIMGPFHQFGEGREAFLRVGQALWNYRRVQKGLPVWDGGINIKGLSTNDAIGKVASTFAVDYGATSPHMDRMRITFAPFITWPIQQMQNWPLYAMRHPGRFAAKMLPLAAVWAWNHGYAPKSYYQNAAVALGGRSNWSPEEMERRHPEWVQMTPFHVNLPPSADGKDRWVSFSTGLDTAMHIFQLDHIMPAIQRWSEGKTTPTAALHEMLSDAARHPVRFFSSVAGGLASDAKDFATRQIPILQAFEAITTGMDPVTKRTIMPNRAKGTPDAAYYAAMHLLYRVILPDASVAARYMDDLQNQPDSAVQGYIRKHLGDLPSRVAGALMRPFMPNVLKERSADEREQLKLMEHGRAATELHRVELSDLEDAFVESEAKGDPDLFSTAMDDAASRGADVSNEDLMNRFRTPQVQERIARRRAELAKTAEERKGWLEDAEAIRQDRQIGQFKQIPKSTRGRVVEQMEAP